MKQLALSLSILFTVVFFCSSSLLSAEFLSEKLSSEDQPAEQSDTLTIIATENNLPFSFGLPDGTLSGLYIEFWELWAETNNIPIRFVLVPFQEGVQLVKQKNTLHAGLFINEQRKQWADFSLPIHNVQTGAVYNSSINKDTTLRELKGIKVSTYTSSYQDSYIRENYPELEQTTYKNFDEAVKQLLDNDVQAIIEEIPWILAQLAKRGLSGVFVISEEVITSNNVFALIAKDQPELLDKINTGIENMPVNKIIELEKKWLPTLKPFFKVTSLASLTMAERKWLQSNNEFTMGFDPDLPPFEFIDAHGNFAGMASDYVKYANELLNINMAPQYGLSWLEAFAAFKNGEIDMMSGAIVTNERLKIMNFTKPYIDMPTAIITRRDSFYAEKMSNLNHKVLGLVEGDFIKFVRDDYPDITIKIVESEVEGLEILQAGGIDAFIAPVAVANYEIDKGKMNDLIIAAFSPYNLKLSMAIRKGLEPLVPILNKSFASMTAKQQSSLNNAWLHSYIQTGIDKKVILSWGLPLVFILLLLIIIFYAHLNKKLKKATIKARTSAVSKGQFLANMSHEIRTPMNGILGMTSLLMSENLSKKHHEMVEVIHNSGDKLLAILDEILNFSKLDSGEVEFEDVIFDLHKLGKDVKHLMQIEANEKLINLYCDFEENEQLFVKGDENRIHQVLVNLLSNAIKFSNDSKVSISIETLESNDHEVTFRAGIKDSGIGIAADNLENIFKEFQQEDSSISRKYGGTGLGLAISKKLVQLMDGEIYVKSEIGKGSHFYFILTLPKASKPTVTTTVVENKTIATKLYQFLVVDDNKVNLMVAEGLLSKLFNCKVDTAINGIEACEKVAEKQYDIVLMDMQMPDMDGLEATQIIRERESTKDTHLSIIAMTANAMAEHKEACIKSGMDDYLSKPVNSDKLKELIYKWI